MVAAGDIRLHVGRLGGKQQVCPVEEAAAGECGGAVLGGDGHVDGG